jgi:hypothetical protein
MTKSVNFLWTIDESASSTDVVEMFADYQRAGKMRIVRVFYFQIVH